MCTFIVDPLLLLNFSKKSFSSKFDLLQVLEGPPMGEDPFRLENLRIMIVAGVNGRIFFLMQYHFHFVIFAGVNGNTFNIGIVCVLYAFAFFNFQEA